MTFGEHSKFWVSIFQKNILFSNFATKIWIFDEKYVSLHPK